ncbi:MAG: tetratricopeptide repeat protein [Verrucomicrobiae bacterium]|nr:tetratricopeptide repeat protein [Verrucomicrobiae bacterium]MDW7979529.1 tetratricopeptide repeat protein [Verrucomicrobiales bacterium]
MTRTRPNAWISQAIFLVLMVLTAYWPVYRGEFVWDDLLLVKQNPIVNGEATLRSVWFQGDFPLTTVAFWLQWQFWADNPLGYHLVNVLLHAFGTLLVWRVLNQLQIRGAWLGAAIFGLHPVCVTSVAWISELKNTLSLPFYLLSLAWWLDADVARERGYRLKAAAYYGMSLSAFVLALLAKTSTVMLPAVILGCVWWKRNRLRREDILRATPYFALALAFGLMTVWFQSQHAISGAPVQTEGFALRIAGAAKVVWFYLVKALLPIQLNLIYPRWEIRAGEIGTYLPLIGLAAAFAACWLLRNGLGRGPLFCLYFFTMNLLPVVGLIDMYYFAISRVSDHLQYIALIGPTALVGAILATLRKPVWCYVAGALVLLCLGGATARRAHVFAAEDRLWRDVLEKNPTAWVAHNNLGALRAEQGRLNEAIAHFEKAVTLKPDNYRAHVNLGRAYAERGLYEKADTHFRAALRIRPLDPDAHKQYGLALARQGRTPWAILHLREALRSRPDAETHMLLAELYRTEGRTDQAITHCRAALKLEPDMPEALNNLAWLLATAAEPSLRNGPEAVRLAERACAITEFKDPRYLGTLAAALAETGRFDEAVAWAQQALAKAHASGDVELAKSLGYLLKLFGSGRPYREPVVPDSGSHEQ